jgi:hypothetical protein
MASLDDYPRYDNIEIYRGGSYGLRLMHTPP